MMAKLLILRPDILYHGSQMLDNGKTPYYSPMRLTSNLRPQ